MKVRTICLTVFIVTWLATGAVARETLYSDGIAAVVNGDVILMSEVEKHKNPAIRNIFNLPLGIVPPGKWPTEKEILDELIVMRLMMQEATEKGLVISPERVDQAIEAIQKRNNRSKEEFIVYLASEGMSYAEYRDLLRTKFTLEAILQREVYGKITLSEEDTQQYFKENRGKIDEQFAELMKKQRRAQPPMPAQALEKPEIPTHEDVYVGGKVRLRRLTLKAPNGDKRAQRKFQAKMRDIYREARLGADFAALAKKYSDDPLASSGGDLGWMTYSGLRGDLKKIVSRIPTGGVSQPLPTDNAVIFLNVADGRGRTKKRVPLPPRIRRQLKQQVEQEWEKAKKQQEEAMKQAEERAAEAEKQEAERMAAMATPKGPDGEKPVKDLGILSPAEEEEYKTVRGKVYSVLSAKRLRERMDQWIENLKRNAIIEVKL